MNLTDVFSAQAIASVHETVGSNKIAYLGAGLFPTKKKMGLDLSWIKTSKGLPVSLAPSAFDTVSTIRSREGIKIEETEMAYFKESMLVKEKDEQEMLRVLDANDPYAKDVLARVFDDAETLIDGAKVVPERMIMQLLTSNGNPSISISADGATYAYNYDPNGSYASNNYHAYSGTSAWSDETNSDPIANIETALDAVEALTGNRPTRAICNSVTFNHIKNNAKVKNAILSQNIVTVPYLSNETVKAYIKSELGVDVIVYNKQYKNEAGVAQKFFADGFFTLIPEGTLGSTWYGTTPDERTLLANPAYDCKVVDGGVAVTVTVTSDPVHTKTTVSEIVLPSFERMDETYTIKAF